MVERVFRGQEIVVIIGNFFMRFEVFTAVKVPTVVFGTVTPCSLVGGCQRFRGHILPLSSPIYQITIIQKTTFMKNFCDVKKSKGFSNFIRKTSG
jgi:hypothetical protein